MSDTSSEGSGILAFRLVPPVITLDVSAIFAALWDALCLFGLLAMHETIKGLYMPEKIGSDLGLYLQQPWVDLQEGLSKHFSESFYSEFWAALK